MLILTYFGDHVLSSVFIALSASIVTAAFTRAIYNLYFHPLAKYPGPWYTSSFSIFLALISVWRVEPQWLVFLTKKYGTNTPIRIAPDMLLFPKPSALKEIYWDPKCNQKSGLYGTGALGPPHLFTTLDGEVHKQLRKALSNAPWTIGQLKNTWEPRIDGQVQLFVQRMTEKAEAGETVCLSDKVAEFAADIMTMISFTNPFGFVKNSRDEKLLLTNWRKGLDFFGFVGRFRFFRNHVIQWPTIGPLFLPAMDHNVGMGFLMAEADRQVSQREKELHEDTYKANQPDFMQWCLDARRNDKPLTPLEKRAHVTLLIMAGADTTGTALGSTLRYLILNTAAMKRVQEEIATADRAGKLSTPVQHEETRTELPFFVACIKEAIRLDPPATNLFARTTSSPKTIEGHVIPPHTDITSNAYVVQRDPELYAPDPFEFRPERWLESQEKANRMDAASFVFGTGPRVCLGKDIATMEMYKLLPEVVRTFEFELLDKGRYVVAGGVAYNRNLLVKMRRRDLAGE